MSVKLALMKAVLILKMETGDGPTFAKLKLAIARGVTVYRTCLVT